MTTLVTGGSGFVGAHLVRALIERGDRVRCLVRELDPENLEGVAVEQVRGDLLDRDSLGEAVAGCDRVYHCAADYRLFAQDPREIFEVNVGGTRRLLDVCRAQDVAKVVVTSSVGALAACKDGVPSTEETPVSESDMVGHYKRSKYLAEVEVLGAVDRGQTVFLAHPSTPIGEFDCKPTPTGKIMVDFLQGKIPAVVDTGLNFVDVRDVAAGHLLVEERGEPGRRYILGGENSSLEEFLALVAEVSGRRPVRRRIPHWIPYLVAGVDTALARILGRTPKVALEGVRMARKKMYFDCSRAKQELNYEPGPLLPAIQRAVTYFRQRGMTA